MNTTVFITGATGLVGGNLTLRLLRDPAVARILLLVRADCRADARTRLLTHLQRISPSLSGIELDDRLDVLAGDVTLPGLGLSQADYERVATSSTHIVHAAANVRFDAPLEELRPVNCGGAQRMLELAHHAKANGRLEHFAYVGTAYVAGNRTGTIYEDDLVPPPSFANPYEQSKFEAEKLVRAALDDLPISILRPSIITGDTRSGVTTAFNGIYYPLRLLYQGRIRYVPGSPDVRLDVVPIDFVTEAIREILFQRVRKSRRVFHLTCAPGTAPRAGDMLNQAASYFSGCPSSTARRVSFIPVAAYKVLRHLLTGDLRVRAVKMKFFIPYLSVERSFDTSAARSALEGSGITPPLFEDYCETLLSFCVKANWGRSGNMGEA
jgi:thioester reductase-like protein